MQNNKALTICSAIALCITTSCFSLPVKATDGASLFKQHCSRCHQSVTRFKTPAAQIPATLKSGNIRQHRFSLDTETIQLIAKYIEEQNS